MDKKQRENSGTYLMFLVYVAFMLVAPFAVLVYWVKCEFHAMATILPIFSDTETLLLGFYSSTHYSFPWVMAMSAIVFVFAVCLVSSTFIYIATLVSMIYLGIDVLNEFTTEEDEALTEPTLREPADMIHNFKCFQIIANELTNATSDFLFPMILSIGMAFNVSLFYALIKLDLDLVHIGGILLLQGIVGILYYGVLHKGCELSAISVDTLATLKIKASVRPDWLRQVNSMKPLEMSIGNFAILNRRFLLGYFR